MKKYYVIMLISAALAAVNVPFGKFLLGNLPTMLIAAITYVGGAIGLGLLFAITRIFKWDKDPLLKGKDWLYILGVNVCDTCANTMLFFGLDMLSGEAASLLQSFEIVSTAVIAFFLFKEKISWRLWLAILIVLCASALLSFVPGEAFAFNWGALLIVGTTIFWGFANNFAKKVADKDPIEYGFFKCLTPSIVLTIIALSMGSFSTKWNYIGLGLLDGFLAYGISIALMMFCFRKLPVALGTALYSTNPFIGAILSLIFFPGWPEWNFYVAIALVLLGEILAGYDGIKSEKEAALLASKTPVDENGESSVKK
jgi:drug/metabolite transporter (DMT)-like permease